MARRRYNGVMHETRQSLLFRARTGEEDAWKDLTDLYRPLIIGWLNRQGVPAVDLEDLSQDIQLSLYQMGARESWNLRTAAQSYYYVLDNEKVPVEHTEDELERVRTTVTEIADGILSQEFEPRPRPDICAACDYRIICPAAEK